MSIEDDLKRPADGATQTQTRARSKAWIYYLILAVASFIAAITGQAIALLGMFLFGAYSVYLYRGGKTVIWFW